MEATTFREAYDVLQRHAETLRRQEEPNIDDLLNIVGESVAAYKTCKQRIDAVERALEEALTDAGLDTSGRPQRPGATPEAPARQPPAAEPKASKSGFDDMEDDIPF